MDLSKRPLRDFLEIDKGRTTNENFGFLRYYTAWAGIKLTGKSTNGLLCRKFEEENIREVPDFHRVGGCSIRVVLGSRGCKSFFSRVNVVEFFDTIGRARTFGSPVQDV